MKKQLLPSLVAVAVLGTAALSASAQNLAIVNGKAVPMERVTALKQQIERSGRQVPAEMDEQIKEEIIAREVFMQEAAKRGLDATPDFKQQMQLARETILIRELFTDYQKKNPVSDAEIKAEYDKFITANAGKEYRARHILVESEDRAKAIIAELKAGKKFEDIAKKESKDPGSGAQGGDLGWASPANYVPEFTEAMLKLKKGGLSDAPVKSQFGWHIIRVDDMRDAQMPALDDVKPQIAEQLQQQKMMQFQEELRAKAKVE
ncbi:MAG TPA: peptidylprolyl isomerase [Comamonas sp.]|uniref:peptidylprolyl isomerase n=1 Tax=Comamonas halotolerans TaxID=3041496 RepID=UPI0024E136DA|nr:peptidylprolyl isomerase [Comamonas sp. NoAH]